MGAPVSIVHGEGATRISFTDGTASEPFFGAKVGYGDDADQEGYEANQSNDGGFHNFCYEARKEWPQQLRDKPL